MDRFLSLRKDGYQILDTPVLTDDECKTTISGLWDWLESLGRGINRTDPTTWGTKNWPKNIHGIIEFPTAAHTIPVWQVRTNPAVLSAFAELWQTTPANLISSFDRICIHRPTTRSRPQDKWLHIDQGPRLRGPRCYQGFVTLADMPSQGGTLTVVPGSHLYHDEFFEAFPDRLWVKPPAAKPGQAPPPRKANTENWLKFNEAELEWWAKKGLKPIRVSAKKGQLVLWDSRTIHCGAYAEKGFEHLWRWVVYVCFKPKPVARDATSKKKLDRVKAKKRKAFEEGRTTSHWPVPEPFLKRSKTGRETEEWMGTKNFGVKPQFSQDQKPEPATALKVRSRADLEAISALGPSLAGF